ncbi:MAG: hypothetical protein CM1200mP2_55140 [Planctomycetaceae bacterium]|nr:MAG: hypothetical protein CM1200mP2_55140 [Planctomycetaceae bacterium]
MLAVIGQALAVHDGKRTRQKKRTGHQSTGRHYGMPP